MPSTRRSPAPCTLVLCALVLGALVPIHPASAQAMGPEQKPRTLSGVVTDPGHEPLRGAIVELQQGGSTAVRTFITTADGHYHFSRLDSEADYTVWVVFRRRHSKSRSISKFDSHPEKVINFTVATF